MSESGRVLTCPEHVYSRDTWTPGHTCGKPVKRDGLCGVHAAAKDRRAAGEADRERKKAIAAALTERLGIEGVTFTHLNDGVFSYALFAPAVEAWWAKEQEIAPARTPSDD